jgi:hypothetical protein
VQVDDALRLGGKERVFRCERVVDLWRGFRLHRLHGDGPETELPGAVQKLTPCGELESIVMDWIHD